MDSQQVNCRRCAATALAAAALLAGCGGDEGAGNPESKLTVSEATAPVDGAPRELAELREQANQLLGGGLARFEARLEELRGVPVVVNKWASWCGPCRFEFPFFQAQAIARGDEIAFLGLNTEDARPAAETFLGELPLPFPSYEDPNGEIARELETGNFFPATVFFASDGKVAHVKPGPYESEADLEADIERYAR